MSFHISQSSLVTTLFSLHLHCKEITLACFKLCFILAIIPGSFPLKKIILYNIYIYKNE